MALVGQHVGDYRVDALVGVGGMAQRLKQRGEDIWQHFQFDGERWMDTKGAGDFFTCLPADASAQAGQNLSFTAF